MGHPIGFGWLSKTANARTRATTASVEMTIFDIRFEKNRQRQLQPQVLRGEN
jgi:hypothetical protein